MAIPRAFPSPSTVNENSPVRMYHPCAVSPIRYSSEFESTKKFSKGPLSPGSPESTYPVKSKKVVSKIQSRNSDKYWSPFILFCGVPKSSVNSPEPTLEVEIWDGKVSQTYCFFMRN